MCWEVRLYGRVLQQFPNEGRRTPLWSLSKKSLKLKGTFDCGRTPGVVDGQMPRRLNLPSEVRVKQK